MPKSARIDEVIQHPDGKVEIRFTQGETPLPVLWSGLSLEFESVHALASHLAQAQENIADGPLLLLQAAKGAKLDPSLGAAFRAAVKGKAATLDLTGALSIIALG